MRWILAVLFSAVALAQTTPVTINMSGQGTVSGSTTLTFSGSGTGAFAPFGNADVSIQGTIAGGSIAGTVNFSVGTSGSLSANFSQSYSGSLSLTLLASVTGGTGIFSTVNGALNIQFNGMQLVATGGSFTITGTGSLLGVASGTAGTPFEVPNAPSGPGPEGDPTLVNCTSCGPPVTLSNGNMFHRFTDLTLPSRGFPIVLQRTYNSQSGADGVFGVGWTHNYQRWLNIGASTVVYYSETGGAYTFAGPGPSFTPPPGIAMTLVKSQQGTLQLQTSHGGILAFDSSGRLTSLTDTNGNAQLITYDAQGRMTTVSDSVGGLLSFVYDSNGHALSVEDSSGRKVFYQYDLNGNMLSSTDATGAVTKYTYSGGTLSTITFPDGGTINYTYDTNDRATQVTDREGARSQYTYTGSQTTVKDPLGFSTAYQFNSLGNSTKITASDGAITSQAFSLNADLNSITDPNGVTTRFLYDSKRNLVTKTDALGGVNLFTYDLTLSRKTSSKDANGNTTLFQYDVKGNLAKMTDALGFQSSFTYDSFGELVTAADPSGATVIRAYDTHGNRIGIRNQLGYTFLISYDSLNRPVQVTDPLGGQTLVQYDLLGRITKKTDPLGNSSTFTYDVAGNLTRRTDAAGSGTTFSYDRLHNLTKVIDALGRASTYSWSPGNCNCSTPGTLSAIANAAGQFTNFTYDSNRRVASSAGAPLGSAQFTYDPAGNPTQTTDANGAVVKLTFDALHRLTQQTLPDGSTAQFTYDANGNVLTAKNADVTLTYAYDVLNRVTSVKDSRFPAATLYTYDGQGKRASMKDPFGGMTTYTYDVAGELTKLGSPDGATTTFGYDALGRRSSITLGNGVAGTYVYDAGSRLTSLAYAKVGGFSYTFDKLGNRLSMTNAAGATTYQYDALSRLTGATHPNGPQESYSYDAVGNRTSANLAPLTLTSGAVSFVYDGLHRLTSATLADGTPATYKYDPYGRRIEKNVGGIVTRYLYDGHDVLLEQDASGAPFRARYTYGPHTDEPLVMERSGVSYYYVADGQGNIVDLTDSTGAIAASYDFDSFGQLLSSTGVVLNPYVFGGRALDAETGLYYARGRYYDPVTGRFLTQDPLSPATLLAAARLDSTSARTILGSRLQSPLSMNAYVYAGNNPVNRRAPAGFDSDDLGLGYTLPPPEMCTTALAGVGVIGDADDLLGVISGAAGVHHTEPPSLFTPAGTNDQSDADLVGAVRTSTAEVNN